MKSNYSFSEREELKKEVSKEIRNILDVETHHEHEIIRTHNGGLRWKAKPEVDKLIGVGKINLNDLIPLFYYLGYDKNSEVYRQLYRDMGYTLDGYWEIFYWEVNNPQVDEYKPNPQALGTNYL